MAREMSWTNGLGFRQLIEDGLAILRNEHALTPGRREYVLSDLSELVFQAKRGSDLMQNRAFSVTSTQRREYESLSVLDRFLNGTENDHSQIMLQKTEQALNELRSAAPVSDEHRDAAVQLFQKILAGLIREPKLGIPNQPQELRVGR